METVEPFFLKKRDIPQQLGTIQLCEACEQVSGPETMIGAQQIKGLWRLYPASVTAREKIIAEGVILDGLHYDVYAKNPFQVNGPNGFRIPVTKLWISDIPLSIAEKDIETMLNRIGAKLQSRLVFERARYSYGALARFLTGRRYVFITIPDDPLPKEASVGFLTCKLYYKEQPRDVDPDDLKCKNCLQTGHLSKQCVNLVVCLDCKLEGHKRGQCDLFRATNDDAMKSDNEMVTNDNENNENKTNMNENVNKTNAEKETKENAQVFQIATSNNFDILEPKEQTNGSDDDGDDEDDETDNGNKHDGSESESAASRRTKRTPKSRKARLRFTTPRKSSMTDAGSDSVSSLAGSMKGDFLTRARSLTPSKRSRENGNSPTDNNNKQLKIGDEV